MSDKEIDKWIELIPSPSGDHNDLSLIYSLHNFIGHNEKCDSVGRQEAVETRAVVTLV